MALYNFHRFLISFAVLFDFYFTLWAFRQWQAEGGAMNLVMAGLSSLAALGLSVYLVYFHRTLALLKRDHDRTPRPTETAA